MADEAPAAAPSMLEEAAPPAPDAGSPRLLRCICLGCTIIEVDVTRVAAHVLLLWQVAMITIFALWADYDYQTGSPLDMTYTWYSDVTLLVLLGFGYHFAMASRYALTAVGFTLLLVALVVQWALLVNGALAGVAAGTGFPEEIAVALDDLISADLAAAAVLVTFGALVGRVSLLQATVLAILETVFFAANKARHRRRAAPTKELNHSPTRESGVVGMIAWVRRRRALVAGGARRPRRARSRACRACLGRSSIGRDGGWTDAAGGDAAPRRQRAGAEGGRACAAARPRRWGACARLLSWWRSCGVPS